LDAFPLQETGVLVIEISVGDTLCFTLADGRVVSVTVPRIDHKYGVHVFFGIDAARDIPVDRAEVAKSKREGWRR
jgi:hypothetical protein